MTEPDKRPGLDDLNARLRAARVQQEERYGSKPRRSAVSASNGMAVGFRIAVEILAGLAVGVGIGLVLDNWLGTAPWMLILFFILGAGASFLNVMRAARELDRQARERRAAARGDRAEDERGPRGGSA